MSEPTVVIEVLKALPSVLVTLIVGIAALLISNSQRKIAASQRDISKQQREIAHGKLNLDLFDKRYEIFDATWRFLSSAVKGDALVWLEPEFTNLIPRAQFLFGGDIAGYMREASAKKTELAMIAGRTYRNGKVVLPGDVDRQHELDLWFAEEATFGSFKRFNAYLQFSAWRSDPLDALLSPTVPSHGYR